MTRNVDNITTAFLVTFLFAINFWERDLFGFLGKYHPTSNEKFNADPILQKLRIKIT